MQTYKEFADSIGLGIRIRAERAEKFPHSLQNVLRIYSTVTFSYDEKTFSIPYYYPTYRDMDSDSPVKGALSCVALDIGLVVNNFNPDKMFLSNPSAHPLVFKTETDIMNSFLSPFFTRDIEHDVDGYTRFSYMMSHVFDCIDDEIGIDTQSLRGDALREALVNQANSNLGCIREYVGFLLLLGPKLLNEFLQCVEDE